MGPATTNQKRSFVSVFDAVFHLNHENKNKKTKDDFTLCTLQI